MKIRFILLSSLFILFSTGSFAQLYEMESSRNVDLSSKTSRMEKVHFTIDSTKMSLQTGDETYHYDAKSFNLDDNGVINMVVLDKNDEEVMIKFSPSEKVLDYYLHDEGIRYFLDKVEMPKPETKPDTTKKDSASEADEELKKDTMIYETAEVMPEYPGGKQAMMNYFLKSEKFPSQAKKAGIQGFVEVDVVVEKDGSIKYMKVKKDIGGGCGIEALRLVKAMPKWTPGTDKGDDVRVRVPITISFMPK